MGYRAPRSPSVLGWPLSLSSPIVHCLRPGMRVTGVSCSFSTNRQEVWHLAGAGTATQQIRSSLWSGGRRVPSGLLPLPLASHSNLRDFKATPLSLEPVILFPFGGIAVCQGSDPGRPPEKQLPGPTSTSYRRIYPSTPSCTATELGLRDQLVSVKAGPETWEKLLFLGT